MPHLHAHDGDFSGCRVLAYCVMCNHFHLLLEVTPRPQVALTDEQLLKRLSALYPKAFVATVAKELADARKVVSEGRARDGEAYVQQIHGRFTYRMFLLMVWRCSRAFADGFFEQCRERFGPKRKSGARKMRGKAAGAAEWLWSARDLRVGIG